MCVRHLASVWCAAVRCNGDDGFDLGDRSEIDPSSIMEIDKSTDINSAFFPITD